MSDSDENRAKSGDGLEKAPLAELKIALGAFLVWNFLFPVRKDALVWSIVR
jgi:hypothetical protein